MKKNFVEISKEEAKIAYCNHKKVYISTDSRKFWKMPASYEYGSHAPINELFYRGSPEYEGNVRFFKIAE